jgi:hypothetical protein
MSDALQAAVKDKFGVEAPDPILWLYNNKKSDTDGFVLQGWTFGNALILAYSGLPFPVYPFDDTLLQVIRGVTPGPTPPVEDWAVDSSGAYAIDSGGAHARDKNGY